MKTFDALDINSAFTHFRQLLRGVAFMHSQRIIVRVLQIFVLAVSTIKLFIYSSNLTYMNYLMDPLFLLFFWKHTTAS